jgi:hypothetical protein
MINYNIFYTAVSSDVPYVATECTTDCTDKAFFDALNDQLDELLPVSPLIGRRMSDVEAIQNTKDQTLFNVLLVVCSLVMLICKIFLHYLMKILLIL